MFSVGVVSVYNTVQFFELLTFFLLPVDSAVRNSR